MRKIAPILLAISTLMLFTSCNSAKPGDTKNTIMPAELTSDQQEIIDLLSIPNKQEPMLFDFNTEETYSGFDVWVEVYENGELIDRPVGVSFHNDTAKTLNGKVAVIIQQNEANYQWSLSVVEDGALYSHVGTAELNLDSTNGNAYGPMNDPASIEAGKEIIIYSSTFAETNTPHRAYDEQTLQEQPELLKEYPAAFLIKCMFSNGSSDYRPMIYIQDSLYGETADVVSALPDNAVNIGKIVKLVAQNEPMVLENLASNVMPVGSEIYGIKSDKNVIHFELSNIYIELPNGEYSVYELLED
jgi:hypothetical protein